MKLKDKVFIVTGGEGLLGKEIVNDLMQNGAIAISADITVKTDYKANKQYIDITSENSVKKVIEDIVQNYGRIDGLVNNAYPRTKDWGCKFEETSYESWSNNVSMQMNTTFLLIKEVMPHLIKNKGSIVNIASIYGVVGNDFSIYKNTSIHTAAPYSAIKGGIINFTKYLASYFGKKGVRINCISPGGVFNNQDPVFVSNYNNKVPMGRMANPDDIAPAVSFMLSDKAKYITGQNLVVDGGWTAI